MTVPFAEEEFEHFLQFLKEKRGLDFTGYKRASVGRRVARRMQSAEMATLAEYMDRLEVDPEEFVYLLNTILINVTAFFRDAPTWEYLQTEVLPQLIAVKESYAIFRVWSAGCASGEEAYTLAILLAEMLGEEQVRERVKIYATDIDEEALAQARRAVYSAKALEPVPEELRAKYFRPYNGQFVFHPELRRSVIFGRHNLLVDAPISNLDLLVSRNTMMYFNAESQRRVLSLFHFALHNDGFLFLGKAEMLLTHTHLFTPIHLRYRIFRKVPSLHPRERVPLPQGGNGIVMEPLSPLMQLREAAAESAPAAEIIVDVNGLLTGINAAARLLFTLTPEDIGRPLSDLTVSNRPLELRSRLDYVFAQRRLLREAEVELDERKGTRWFEVDIIPLSNSAATLIGASIVFTETTPYHDLHDSLERTKEDLQSAHEELQSTNEELETTNEELQSSNEELETTNEELQSSNEELETMNEELQSSNEELHTANEELRQSMENTSQSNSFLYSILASVDAGVAVVDLNLVVRIWNHQAEDMWGLRTDEVVGMFFLNLDIGLPLDKVKELLRQIISGESEKEFIILEAVNRRGRKIHCRVSVTPLSRRERPPQGVVVMMEDIEPVLEKVVQKQQ